MLPHFSSRPSNVCVCVCVCVCVSQRERGLGVSISVLLGHLKRQIWVSLPSAREVGSHGAVF